MMNTSNELNVNSDTLIQAWQHALPEFIKPTGESEIQADAKSSNSLLIHIKDDGRSHYSFDFRVNYVDDREINVEFLDVEKAGMHVDDNSEAVQTLAKDYVRHIHECAQHLKELTKS